MNTILAQELGQSVGLIYKRAASHLTLYESLLATNPEDRNKVGSLDHCCGLKGDESALISQVPDDNQNATLPRNGVKMANPIGRGGYIRTENPTALGIHPLE